VVSCMTRRVDRLHPKSVGSLILIKHGSYHHYESSVLPFDHPIRNEGFVSQDHIGGFSTKRECANTHKYAYNTKYEIQVKVITD
jgi:hypothetical protein